LGAAAGAGAGGAAGQCLFSLDFGARNPVADFALLPSGGLLACCWDGMLRHIDMHGRRCANLLQGSSAGLRAVCCPDVPAEGGLVQVFVGTEDAHIVGVSIAQDGELQPRHSWKAHFAQVNALRAYKAWLVSASDDRSIRIWTADRGELLEEFRGHAGAVLALDVSPQSRLVWSGSRDWTIRSWDLGEIENRVRERESMARLDAESASEEARMRLALKNVKKKKPKPKKAAGPGASKKG